MVTSNSSSQLPNHYRLTCGCGLVPGGYLDPGQGAERGERLAPEAERLDTGQDGDVTL